MATAANAFAHPTGEGTADAASSPTKAADLLARLETEVTALTTSEGWRRYLTMQARLHRYSFGNVLLIAMQKPDASHVAGYKAWQELGRQVKRGERGIAILAPHTYTPRAESQPEQEATSDDEPTRRVGFHITHVWDIGQTDGPPITDWGTVTGDEQTAQEATDRLMAHAATRGYTVTRESEPGRVRGHCDHKSRRIVVEADLNTVNTCAVLAHAALHDGITAAEYLADRGRFECEAESVAYVVVAGLGLETGKCALPYVAGWTSGDTKVIRDAARRVQETAADLLRIAERKEPPATAREAA